ncbi:MAG TPA: NDP-sugar synthase, partial [Thermoleophilaceae bacterium]|nr:NDP-sugar synthase [Thermoleophilaceae bacterium]
MQALVLAGGQGTRLRPLTLTTPKPVMPLAGRPFLTFMLSWLARHGVDDAILSCGHLSDAVERVLGDEYEGVKLHHVVEEEKLDTAGPVRLAYEQGLLQERLFVMNGDCLADLDLSAELAFHESKGAACTLGLVAVDDTSAYGVVPTREDGSVEAFLEKQSGPVPTNRINAGAYVIERSVVEDFIPSGRPCSFEREVFPALVDNGQYGWQAEGYWIDIGTPERYLEATYDLLAGRVESTLPARDETDSLIHEPSIVAGARVGPLSVVGQHCSVGDRSAVERSVLHDSVVVGHEARIVESVVAE